MAEDLGAFDEDALAAEIARLQAELTRVDDVDDDPSFLSNNMEASHCDEKIMGTLNLSPKTLLLSRSDFLLDRLPEHFISCSISAARKAPRDAPSATLLWHEKEENKHDDSTAAATAIEQKQRLLNGQSLEDEIRKMHAQISAPEDEVPILKKKKKVVVRKTRKKTLVASANNNNEQPFEQTIQQPPPYESTSLTCAVEGAGLEAEIQLMQGDFAATTSSTASPLQAAVSATGYHDEMTMQRQDSSSRKPATSLAAVEVQQSQEKRITASITNSLIDDNVVSLMDAEIQNLQATLATSGKLSEPASPRAVAPAGFLTEIQMQHRNPANLLAEIQQQKQETVISNSKKQLLIDDDMANLLEAEIQKMQADIAASISAALPASPPAATPDDFLAAIPQHKKPSNLLAEIQQRKQPAPSETSLLLSTAVHSNRSLDYNAARLEAEIQAMQADIAATKAAASKSPDVRRHTQPGEQAPSLIRPPILNLLGAIENAATNRVKRLEVTGGELIMQDIAPEVEVKQSSSRQLSTSMAEMISQKAAARDKRLAEGGEKRMRKIKIKDKDEYKKDFSSIVTDAAALGRLTRLNEYTVEAIAPEKTPEQVWKSNGLLAIQWRSTHMSVIHEAANAGNMFKMPEHITSNFPEEQVEEEWDPETDGKFISPRMRELLDLNNHVGEGQQKVDKVVLGRKERQGKLESLLIKPMQAYSNIEEMTLPRKATPKIDPVKNAEKLSKMKREALVGGRPMIDISAGVAELAWERRARLDRPGSSPKIKEVCSCPYCVTASPYQTFAYRELERKHKEKLGQQNQARLEAHEKQDEIPDEKAEGNDETDELARKHRERLRIREERRKLQQKVAEAEEAVAEAQAAADVRAASPLDEVKPAVAAAAPDGATDFSAVEDSGSQRIAAPQHPPIVDTGCKCVIM